MPDEQTASPGAPVHPFGAYDFVVRVDGVPAGHFTECSGLEIDVMPIAYREAGTSQLVQHIPGRVEYAGVTLRYGLTDAPELWNWFMAGVKGTVDYRNVSIGVLASDRLTERMTWNLIRAWPAKWRGVAFDAMTNEMAIEEIHIVFERLERDPPGS